MIASKKPTYYWPIVFAKSASALVIVCGMTVILGWIFYLWLPKDSLSLLFSIKPNVALCFILSGIALWAKCDKSKISIPQIAQLSCSVVFLIGTLTLFEYFFHVDLGIDQGLFIE